MEFRNLMFGLDAKVQLKGGEWVPEINFNNAATTPAFSSVVKKINDFLPMYGTVNNGQGQKSKNTVYLFEEVRAAVLDFVKGDKNKDVVIFLGNATEAINKLSYRFTVPNKNDVILSTEMEHYSNDLPWREKYTIDYAMTDNNGRLSIEDLENRLKKHNGKVKLVTVCGVSNVTGYVNPIYKIAEIAHKYKAMIHVDGSQHLPHLPMDMKPSDSPQHIDFLSFSAHKMYAPFGTGVLIGPKSIFDKGIPEYVGGRAAQHIAFDSVKWETPPKKEEVGTPNTIGVIALSEAIKILSEIGMENVQKYETDILNYATQKLKDVPDLHIYADNTESRVGIIPMNMRGIPHDILSRILANEAAIGTRNGDVTAAIYINKLLSAAPDVTQSYIEDIIPPPPGLSRVSFGIYNTKEEVDVLADLLYKISSDKKRYVEMHKTPN
ncbi:MAG TPA: aminotransferase class V-fold PLP-dependent enzyme [Clostridia bacterium]